MGDSSKVMVNQELKESIKPVNLKNSAWLRHALIIRLALKNSAARN
jgi:hypothetical protein